MKAIPVGQVITCSACGKGIYRCKDSLEPGQAIKSSSFEGIQGTPDPENHTPMFSPCCEAQFMRPETAQIHTAEGWR